MMRRRAPLPARKRPPAEKSPALLKYFFSSKTPDLETRASTPEQFIPNHAAFGRDDLAAQRTHSAPLSASGGKNQRFRSALAARARKCMRQEMAIRPRSD